MAAAGARTGYRLVPFQLLLIPVLFSVQEMVVRLAVHRRQGLIALAREEIGNASMVVLLVSMLALNSTALVSQLSGVAALGQLYGLSSRVSCILASCFLFAVASAGRPERMEYVGLCLGSGLVVFVVTAALCGPNWSEMANSFHVLLFPSAARAAQHLPRDLVVANIGAVVTPWMLFYQASAIVEKRLTADTLMAARLDTLVGSVATQFVTTCALVTFAVQARGLELDTLPIGDVFFRPLQPLLGVLGRIAITAGLLGSSLLSSLVVCLGLSWNLSEVFAPHGAAGTATSSKRFLALFGLTVVMGALSVGSRFIGIVRLNILIQMLNGVVMPIVVGHVFYLATSKRVLGENRVKGVYAIAVGIALFACVWFALSPAIWMAAATSH